MRRVALTPFAKLLELNLALNQFFIFSRMIVRTFTFCAREFYKIFL